MAGPTTARRRILKEVAKGKIAGAERFEKGAASKRPVTLGDIRRENEKVSKQIFELVKNRKDPSKPFTQKEFTQVLEIARRNPEFFGKEMVGPASAMTLANGLGKNVGKFFSLLAKKEPYMKSTNLQFNAIFAVRKFRAGLGKNLGVFLKTLGPNVNTIPSELRRYLK